MSEETTTVPMETGSSGNNTETNPTQNTKSEEAREHDSPPNPNSAEDQAIYDQMEAIEIARIEAARARRVAKAQAAKEKAEKKQEEKERTEKEKAAREEEEEEKAEKERIEKEQEEREQTAKEQAHDEKSEEDAEPKNADDNVEKEAQEEEKADDEKMEEDESDKSDKEPEKAATRGRGRPKRVAPAQPPVDVPAPATGKRGRKRKGDEQPEASQTPQKQAAKAAPRTPRRTPAKRAVVAKSKLTWEHFFGDREAGDRVLSCGEGDQLGHPGRSTTKKPRKVDVVEELELKVVQVCAGGVHSLLLTDDGTVYTCGINEKGTVPGEGVEPEGSTDEFVKIVFTPEIEKEGKIIQITAGASFSAALTDLGSVIAWGNLRDSSGLIDVHPLLHQMKIAPVVVVHHKSRHMVKIAAGENHLAMLSADGDLLTFGDGSMGQLGRSMRAGNIRSKYMCDESGRSLVVSLTEGRGFKKINLCDVHASGFWTMAKAEDGRIFAFGLNNFGHLGIPVQDAEADKAAAEADDRELRVLLPTHATAFDGHDFTNLDGVQHVIARDKDGNLFGIGKNTDNALGLGTWTGNQDQEHWKYDALQKVELGGEVSAGVTAKLGCSIAWTKDGNAYSWGCDTSGQLGLGLKDDDEKVVASPEKVTSAHLDGFKIISVSIADNHALFLAKKA